MLRETFARFLFSAPAVLKMISESLFTPVNANFSIPSALRERKPSFVQRSLKICLFLSLLFCGSMAAHSQPADALAWLKKIGEAQKELNYYGTFVYAHDGQLESMMIVHSSSAEGERERLVHLNGVAREVIRNNDLVTCIFPEEKSVLVAHRNNLSTSPFIQSESLEIFEAYYHISLGGKERIAGVLTQRIDLKPKDVYRYGYRFWVSPEGLLLRSDLLNSDGSAIERIMFTDIHLVEQIPHELMSPKIDLTGFKWFRQEPAVALDESVKGRWRVSVLPDGFSLKSQNLHQKEGDRVEHMLISDGLASISIFIEKYNRDEARMGDFRVGALNGFGRPLGDYVVVVVGDVPLATVKLIAESVVAND